MATNTIVETTSKGDAPSKGSELCVVDVGKYSRKQIRRLRRGEGKLMTKAEQIVQDLKDNGVLAKDANTVVLVVRQKVVPTGLLNALTD
jgi:hypothetical protein